LNIRQENVSVAASSSDVLQGTLDLLVLKALSLAPMHGWGISQRIQQLSRDALQIGQGSLYPALYRLEKRGLVKSEWSTTENNREAKYYRLSAAGQRALATEMNDWRKFAGAVDLVLLAEEAR
jgi:PadR family transcriptional regulator, regulatory protein PadR